MIDKAGIGIAGMPGSGKTAVASTALEMGYPVVNMGDIIREEASKRGLKPTSRTMGVLIFKIREEVGPTVVAEKSMKKCEEAPGKLVVIDGVRSMHEVSLFKKSFKRFRLLAVQASREKRFQNLYARRRSDDPRRFREFLKRDAQEKRLGVEAVIEHADETLVNEGSLADLKVKARDILRRLGSIDALS